MTTRERTQTAPDFCTMALYDRTVPLYDRTVPLYSRTVPLYDRAVPLYDRAVPLYSRAVPLYDRAVPLYSRTVPLYDRAMPLYDRTVPLYNRTVPLYSRAVPLYDRAVPLYSRTEPLYDRAVPLNDRTRGATTNVSLIILTALLAIAGTLITCKTSMAIPFVANPDLLFSCQPDTTLTKPNSSNPKEDPVYFDSCHQASPFCGSYSVFVPGSPYSSGNNECCEGDITPQCCVDYSCINTTLHNPRWFFLKVDNPGLIVLHLFFEPPKLLRYICWGPFTTPTGACLQGLTPDKIADCEGTNIGLEPFYCTIPNAQTGEYYLVVVKGTNVDATLNIYQSNLGEPGAGSTTCDIVNHCTVLELSANAGACNPASNTFTVTGEVYFVNQPPTGQLVVYDNLSGNSSVYNAPFTSPLSYAVEGIACDNQLHTITASFWDSAYCERQTTVQAPVLCPDATIGGGGAVCDDGSTLPITISFAPAALPLSFAYARNGVTVATINGYSGPFPYQFSTNQPGVYTLLSASNAYCNGALSGQATLVVNPLPVVDLGSDTTACHGVPVVLDAGAGFAAYLWQPGEETTRWIAPATSGTFTATVTDTQGCQGSDEVVVNRRPPVSNNSIKHN